LRLFACYGCQVESPELGVYLTLYDDSQPDGEDSTLGPFDELTVRTARVVGERGELGRIVAAHGSKGGWLGVQSEPQRSFASGPTPAERSHMRVRAGEADVFLRLFDDAPERSAAVPELGPFGAVVIGANDIRADGRTVAVRVSPTASWLLTDLVGAQLQGVPKAVVTFRAAKPATVASATGPTARRSIGPGIRDERSLIPTAQHSSAQPDPSPAQPSPSVWVDRVRAQSEIYISRPDVSKKP
jgi:hypothetical protein